MRIYFLILSFITLFSVCAQADKKQEVPFRTDSGLISAEYYLANGKYAEALDVLGGVLHRHPENADAYTYRGYAYQKLGETEKARENYAKALTLDSAHLGANKYMAGLYLDAGNLARAMEQMQVIRMVCGVAACEELDEMEADINRYKAEKK